MEFNNRLKTQAKLGQLVRLVSQSVSHLLFRLRLRPLLVLPAQRRDVYALPVDINQRPVVGLGCWPWSQLRTTRGAGALDD